MLGIKPAWAVYDNIGGEERIFCCEGCRGVYRIIHDAGLHNFYADRKGWSPGPSPARQQPETAPFKHHVRELSGGLSEINLSIGGIRCASCVWLNEKLLGALPGVSEARVNYATHRARIRWNPSETTLNLILSRIAGAGYEPIPFDPCRHQALHEKESKDLLIRFGTAAFFSMQLMMYSAGLYAGAFDGMDDRAAVILKALAFLMSLPVLFYSALPLHRAALKGLRNRVLNMDFLVSAGSATAWAFSVFAAATGGDVYFDTSAMIVTLVLLGRYIEIRARGRASDTLELLAGMRPATARLVRVPGGREKHGEVELGEELADLLTNASRETVRVEDVEPGQWFEVLPGERIPRDGRVLWGSAEVDESMITGESQPLGRSVDDTVIGGTANLGGVLLVEASGREDESVLSGILRMVEEAQNRKAPVQSLADRVVGIFVPFVAITAAFAGLAALYRGLSISGAAMNAVSVLVVACPCALGLATPLAVFVAIGRGARKGLLIKGGDVIERLHQLKTVLFDKTGTLTTGGMKLDNVVCLDIGEKDEILRTAASLESYSEHPVGRALTYAAPGAGRSVVEDLTIHPGLGLEGSVEGRRSYVGNADFMEMKGFTVPDSLSDRGVGEGTFISYVFFAQGGVVKARFDFLDELRPEGSDAARDLESKELDLVLVTGDSELAAMAVSQQTGINRWHARMLPSEKQELVMKLQHETGPVMMVGDGINDAPALSQADVGVALAQGTDVAFESADVVILSNRLSGIPETIEIGKRSYSIIRQNMVWAFGYNLIMIPVAAMGMLHPVFSAAAMAFSSLGVVINSLRIR